MDGNILYNRGSCIGVLVFVLYKKRHAIAGVLKKFGRGGDTE